MKPESWLRRWLPAVVLAAGCLTLLLVKRQVVMPLIRPLTETLPDTLAGIAGTDQIISPEERAVSGVSQYVFRVFGQPSDPVRLSVYVGYYEAQTQGKTIHSPKNCLPGAGWEPIESGSLTLEEGGYRFPVNRYVLENRGRQALVYYWYQGRGRISASEYLVKWEQVRDRAISGRSDEALVRVVVPLTRALDMRQADSLAVEVSRKIVRPIYSSLPDFPSRVIPGA